MKSIKRALRLITLSSLICTTLIIPVYAQDDNISISPIFTDNHGPWYPGKIDNNDFDVSNNLSKSIKLQKMYVKLESLSYKESNQAVDQNSKGYREIIQNSKVTIKYGTNEVYKGTLENLLNKDGIGLETYDIIIGSKSKANFNMDINMDGDSITNDAQSISAEYSISLNYREYNSDGGGIIWPEEPPVTPEDPEEPSNPGGGDITQPEKPNPDEDIDKPGSGDDTNKPGTEEDNSNNGSDVGGSEDKLPQTGGLVNGASLTALGIGVAGIGIALDRKSSDKGGKSDE